MKPIKKVSFALDAMEPPKKVISVRGLLGWRDQATTGENRTEALIRILDCALAELISLDLKGLGLRSVPHEIEDLTQLEYLDLSENQLSELPTEILNFSNLKDLRFERNYISEIPTEILDLGRLENLAFAGNPIVPDKFQELCELAGCDFSRDLPEESQLTYSALAQHNLNNSADLSESGVIEETSSPSPKVSNVKISRADSPSSISSLSSKSSEGKSIS